MRSDRCRKEGTTLVELIVSLALMGIMMVMVIGVVSPAARTFMRLQRVQFAQLMLDNVEDEIRSQLQDAVDRIKIYDISDGGSLADKLGSSSGAVLEYLNTYSYVTVISADGCDETTLIRSGQPTGTEKANPGRLLVRYYWQREVTPNGNHKYNYTEEGNLVARAVQQVFADKYYMGNYLKLNFTFPDEAPAEGAEVKYIKVHAALYRDDGYTDLLASDDFSVDLRYKAKRVDDITAEAK